MNRPDIEEIVADIARFNDPARTPTGKACMGVQLAVQHAPALADYALSLEAALREAEEALKPFADIPRVHRATEWAETNDPWPDNKVIVGFDEHLLTVGHVRAARSVLSSIAKLKE